VRRLIWLRWTGALLFALASQSSAVRAAEVNVVSKVEVRGRAVEILASRKPNFTTFTMTDPPRLVVDISEAVFAQVPEEMRVQNGTIRTIKTAGYGSGASAIARVIIGFEHNVETDITPFGDNGLLVKMLGDSGPPAVAAAEAPVKSQGSPERSSSPTTESAAATDPAKSTVAEAADEEKPAPTSAKGKRAMSVAEAKPAPAAAESKPASLVAEAQTGPTAAKAKPSPTVEEAKPAPSVAKAQPAAAVAETKLARAAAESKPPEDQKRMADLASAERERANKEAEELKRQREEKEAKLREAEAKRKAQEEKQRQIAAEEQKKKEEQRLAKQLERERAQVEAERRKQAEVEKKKKIEEERLAKRLEAQERAKAEQERRRQARNESQRKREAARLARQLEHERAKAEKQGRRRELKVASASTVQSDAIMDEAAPLRRQRPTGGRNLVTFVGFTQQSSGSRIFVRTSGPAQYSVAQAGDKVVVLELENARIGVRNNSRPLDTSQFDSPIKMVEPHQASGRTVRVQIRLRDAVPYQAKQEGNQVFLDFGPPAHP